MHKIASIAALAATGSLAQTTPPTSPWKINCQTLTSPDGQPGPAFTTVQPRSDGEYNVVFSSFARQYGAIAATGGYGNNPNVDNFCDVGDNSSYTQIVDTNIFNWPNGVSPVPIEVFGSDGYLAVADGFGTPAAHDGCIAIVNTNTNLPANVGDIQFISQGCGQGNLLQTKYFYHYIEWVDMDGDGDLDILTARGSSLTSPVTLDASMLVWYQNPGSAFSTTARNWKEFVIESSEDICDVGFDLVTYKNQKYVVCGGFASGVMATFTGSDWANTANIKATIVETRESTMAQTTNTTFYFSQTWADMNNDGIPDAIVTIGSYGVNYGKLLVYPGVDTDGVLSLGAGIMVYDQFPLFSSSSVGSPGEAFPFYYGTQDQANGVLPSILVSGDDDGIMYMFDPTGYVNPDGSDFNWVYNAQAIMKTKQFSPFVTPFNAPTVGQPTIADVDGDGCNDIVVPSYYLKQMIFLEQKNKRNCASN